MFITVTRTTRMTDVKTRETRWGEDELFVNADRIDVIAPHEHDHQCPKDRKECRVKAEIFMAGDEAWNINVAEDRTTLKQRLMLAGCKVV